MSKTPNQTVRVSINTLPDEWVEEVIALYKSGAGDYEVISHLQLTPNEFDNLYKSDKYFKDVVDFGNVARKAWWFRWGRENLNAQKANYTGWTFQMKNFFGLSDKPDDRLTDGDIAEMPLEEVEKKLRALAKKFFDKEE